MESSYMHRNRQKTKQYRNRNSTHEMWNRYISICKTAKVTHNWILSSIVKYKLIYMKKKSSLMKVYLRSPYNKPCIKALFTQTSLYLFRKNRIHCMNRIHWINCWTMFYEWYKDHWYFNINSTQHSEDKWGSLVEKSQ